MGGLVAFAIQFWCASNARCDEAQDRLNNRKRVQEAASALLAMSLKGETLVHLGSADQCKDWRTAAKKVLQAVFGDMQAVELSIVGQKAVAEFGQVRLDTYSEEMGDRHIIAVEMQAMVDYLRRSADNVNAETLRVDA